MISFREVDLGDAQRILDWRTSPHVTSFMNTDLDCDLAAQREWLASCYDRRDYYHWIVLFEGNPVGLINLMDYSEKERRTSWGYYIGAENMQGTGAFVPPYFYNFVFGKLGVQEVLSEVFYNNLNVIGLHRLHGYKFCPSADRVIVKNGKEVLLVAMSLRREAWNGKRYRKCQADFPVREWKTAPAALR